MGVKPKAALAAFDAYTPDVARATDVEAIRLSVNEGALGASPKAVAALAAMGARLHRYPEQIDGALVASIAEFSGCDGARILTSNGSDELIGLLATAYCDTGDEAIITQYGFLVFRQAVTIAGGVPVIAADAELTVSVDAILACLTPRTKLIFLANPNNPTGTMLGRDEVERLIAHVPKHVVIVLDAAYAEYVEDADYTAGSDLVDRHENVVMLRTFSKLFGLAHLRLGWGYLPPKIYATIAAIRGAFSVNGAAAVAGAAALGDAEFYRRSLDHNRQWMPKIQASIRQAGFMPLPSVANFFLIRFSNDKAAAKAHAFLAARGILLRKMRPYGLADCLRMSIGTDAEMEAVSTAFKDLAGLPEMGQG